MIPLRPLLASALLAAVATAGTPDYEAALADLERFEPLTRLQAQWTLEALAWGGGEAALVRHLERRGDEDLEAACCLVQALGELGAPKAVPVCAHLARRGWHVELQVVATVALAKVGTPPARDALRALVRDRGASPPVRRLSLLALATLGDPALLELARPLLSSRRAPDRGAAYRALGDAAGPKLADRVWRGLGDRAPEVQCQAAWSLARLGAQRRVTKLAALAEQLPDEGLRLLLVDLLARLGVAGARRELARRAQDPADALQFEATLALLAWGDDGAAPALRAIVDGALAGAEHAPAALSLAAFGLGALEDDRHGQALAALLASQQPLPARRLAAAALGKLADPDLEPALVAAARDPDLLLAAQALDALGRLPPGEDPLPLRAFVTRPEPALRYLTVAACEARGIAGSSPALDRLLRDSALYVRAAAQRARAGAPPLPDPRNLERLLTLQALEREFVLGTRGNLRTHQGSFELQHRTLVHASTWGGALPAVEPPATLPYSREWLDDYDSNDVQAWREDLDAAYALARLRTVLEHGRRSQLQR